MFASFRSRLHTKTIFVPEVRLFSISLLVCGFNPHRQTWYQKFIGTYPPLKKTKTCKSTCSCRRHIFYQNKENQPRFRLVLCDKGCDNANRKKTATRQKLPATNVKYPATRESIPRQEKVSRDNLKKHPNSQPRNCQSSEPRKYPATILKNILTLNLGILTVF